MLALVALAACGGSDDGTEAGTAAADGTTSAATTTETEPSVVGDAEAGAAVFETAGCGGCHTLAAAGSTGAVGPNLDELQPDLEAIVEQVTNGGGPMPAFGGRLTEEQIRDVAAYVFRSTSGAGGETGSDDSGSSGAYG